MSTTIGTTPQGPVPAIGVPNSQDYPRLVFTAPYFETVPLAELIEPAVIEAVEAALPALVPPYVDAAADAAVSARAVLLTGSTMSGPLFLAPTIPTQPSQAASMAYVDLMVSTAGVPEVPVVPAGQTWARQTGQWVPIDDSGGAFLALGGGTMMGQINMGGNAITNLPTLPVMPNGAAPATWVLNQIAAQSLYQGTWNVDTYTPDLTQGVNQQNSFTWIAVTTSLSGVVVVPPIPGLQGQTVFNGDTIIWSAIAGQYQRIHSGGLTLDEANALYLQLAGGQMSGSLLLHANATQPTEAVTLQQMNTAVAGAGIGEAPATGQLYGRNGQSKAWSPVLPLAGGTMTAPITLSGNVAGALNAVPLQQLQSTVSAAVAPMVPLAGATMSGPLVLSGNAATALGAVPLQQVSGMLAGYLPLSGGATTGPVTIGGTGLTVTNNAAVGGTLTAPAIGATTLSGPTTLQGVTTIAGGSPVGLNVTGALASGFAVSLNSIGAASDCAMGFSVPTIHQWAVGVAGSGRASPGAFYIIDETGTPISRLMMDTSGQTTLTSAGTANSTLTLATFSNGPFWSLTAQTVANGDNFLFWDGPRARTAGFIAGADDSLNWNYDLTVNGVIYTWNTKGITYAFLGDHGVAFGWSGSAINAYVDNAFIGVIQTSPSSERNKTAIGEPECDPLADVRSLQLHSFDQQFHPDSPPQHRPIGLIAEEVREVAADAVNEAVGSYAPDGTPSDEKLLSLDLLPLVARCVGAIQQLVSRVEALERGVVSPT